MLRPQWRLDGLRRLPARWYLSISSGIFQSGSAWDRMTIEGMACWLPGLSGPTWANPGRGWALWVQTAACSQAEDGGVLSAIGVWTARVEGHRRGRGEVGSNGTGVGRGLRGLHAVLGCQLLSENGGEPRGARGRASDVTWESSPGNQHSHSTDQEHGELRQARVMRPAGVGVGMGVGWGGDGPAHATPAHATPTYAHSHTHTLSSCAEGPHPLSCCGCTWAPPGVGTPLGLQGPAAASLLTATDPVVLRGFCSSRKPTCPP